MKHLSSTLQVRSPGRRLPLCTEMRNEVDPANTTDFSAKPPLALTILVLGGFHFLCCGVPLLLLSGLSLATLIPSWPVIVGTAAAGVLVLCVRRYRKSCDACPQATSSARTSDRLSVEARSLTVSGKGTLGSKA